jgi:hypothetical protein
VRGFCTWSEPSRREKPEKPGVAKWGKALPPSLPLCVYAYDDCVYKHLAVG